MEALISTILGAGLAALALWRLPRRFPQRGLTLATGPAAAATGAVLTDSVLGGGQPVVAVAASVCVAAAMLSLLMRGGRRATRPVTADFVRL